MKRWIQIQRRTTLPVEWPVHFALPFQQNRPVNFGTDDRPFGARQWRFGEPYQAPDADSGFGFRTSAMKNTLIEIRITPPQADALAKLIRLQLAAYAEADSAEAKTGYTQSTTESVAPLPKPFTGRDLERIAPLLERLEMGVR